MCLEDYVKVTAYIPSKWSCLCLEFSTSKSLREREVKKNQVFWKQDAKRVPPTFAWEKNTSSRYALELQYICPFWSLQWHVTTKGGHSLSALTTICSYKLRKGQSHSHKYKSQVVGSQMLPIFKCFPALYSYKAYSLTPWLNKEFT